MRKDPLPPALVFIVGCHGALRDRCFRASARHRALGRIVSLLDLATEATHDRPAAILVASDVYDFDAQEFEALGRDVDSIIIVASEEVTDLEDNLRRALRRGRSLGPPTMPAPPTESGERAVTVPAPGLARLAKRLAG